MIYRNKDDFRILVWMIIPFFLFFLLIMFSVSIFWEATHESLNCDLSGCTYQKNNIFGKLISSDFFKKEDIYNMRMISELHDPQTYYVYIYNKGPIKIESSEAYNYIKNYTEDNSLKVNYDSTNSPLEIAKSISYKATVPVL